MLNKKPRILCVDDEPTNLKLFDIMLSAGGWDIVKAKNGKMALEKLKEQDIDLVILDIMMPEMSGFEVCKRIKEDEQLRHIPVVIITALSSKEDRIKGIEVGADEFLSKPFDQGEVIARVTMLLKMKELNNSLNIAYNNITKLSSFGEEIINKFNVMDFNFMHYVDLLVEQLISKKSDDIHKPNYIIVGIKDVNNWDCYKYSSNIRENITNYFCHECINFFQMPEKGLSKTVYYNYSELSNLQFSPLISNLEKLSINVQNLISYLSNNFCIIALNYGRDVNFYDASVLKSLVIECHFLRSLSNQVKEIEESYEYIIHSLARAAEVNDEDTGNHIVRVGEYCVILAKKLGMSDNEIQKLRLDAQLHDVGKIHIPPAILKKAGKLTPEEWEIMKSHTIYGAKIIGDHSKFKNAKDISLTHHERWDGTGYPQGLKGDQIPIVGRITNIADQYDAMRNPRVYKPAFDHGKTYNILTEGDGRTMPFHFDPLVLKAFKDCASQFEEIYEKLKG